MILSDFLTTVSKNQCLDSVYSLTLGVHNFWGTTDSQELIHELTHLFGKDYQVDTFYNARTALYQYLMAHSLPQGSEVILSGFNCVSVVNAVIQAGLTPVYSDIERESFGLDFKTLKQNITNNTKVIIIQHSFGVVSRDMLGIIELARDNGIIVIEDVAHGLGARFENKLLGTFGDAAFFSSGRDKVVSSISGGWLLQKQSTAVNIKIHELRQIPKSEIIKCHIYNIFGYLAKISYNSFKIGRIIMVIAQKFKLYPKIISLSELRSEETNLSYRLPNSLAFLLRKELKRLKGYTHTRKSYNEIYTHYFQESSYIKNIEKGNAFRFPYICKDHDEQAQMITHLKMLGIRAGVTWSGKNIAPIKTNLANTYYKLGSCPVAEEMTQRMFFLPNSYAHTKKEIITVAQKFSNYLEKNDNT